MASDREHRRVLGAWATPAPLVEHLVAQALDPVLAARSSIDGLRVVDPACGDGRFLLAAADRIRDRFGVSAELALACCHGVDVDPAALERARAALGPSAVLTEGDGLRHEWAWGSYDAVLGNPPFLGQLATRTSRGGRSALGGGPYADTAAVFLALALRLARPDGGHVGFVLPASFLSTRDAAPIRADALAAAELASVWWSATPMFDAQVRTCALSFVRGRSQGTIHRFAGPELAPLADHDGVGVAGLGTWGPLVAEAAGIPSVPTPVSGGPCLGDLATVSADFRDQYYGLVPHVRDDADGPPLVTTGAIEVGRCTWGTRPVRFARQSFRSPRVDVAALDERMALWARRRLVPKVLVATQTPVIEAVVDERGEWLPSVPVISVVPHAGVDPWLVAAALTSPVTTAWAAASSLGTALSAQSIKLSAAQVRALPVPKEPWPSAVAALRAGDAFGCAAAMCAAMGVEREPLLTWWAARAGMPGPGGGLARA
jgi:SAM-dependent methyltransferase